MASKNSRGYNPGSTAFVGCLLLGLGIGAWLDHTISGTIIGIGAGFLSMALIARNK